jgi:hypothetical protein
MATTELPAAPGEDGVRKRRAATTMSDEDETSDVGTSMDGSEASEHSSSSGDEANDDGSEMTLRSRLRNCLHDFEAAAHQVTP